MRFLESKVTITKVQLVKAAEIFRAKPKDPEQQMYGVRETVNGRDVRIASFANPQGPENSPKNRLAQ